MNHSTNEKKCCDLCNESFIGCRQADCPCHRAEKRCEACEIERAVPQPQGDHTCLLRGPRQDTTTTNSEKNSNGIVVPDTEEKEFARFWAEYYGRYEPFPPIKSFISKLLKEEREKVRMDEKMFQLGQRGIDLAHSAQAERQRIEDAARELLPETYRTDENEYARGVLAVLRIIKGEDITR